MKRSDVRPVEPAPEVDALATLVIDAAKEVHRVLGPGFLEAVYEQALDLELTYRRIPFVRQPPIPVVYRDCIVGEARPDFLVSEHLIVELKAIEQLAPVHIAQALSYLRATGLALCLIINFNVPVLLRGVRRVILSASY